MDRDLKSLANKINSIDSKNNLCACKGQKDCQCDLDNSLPQDFVRENSEGNNIRMKGKKGMKLSKDIVDDVKDEMDHNKEEIMSKMKGSQCNVNTTMN